MQGRFNEDIYAVMFEDAYRRMLTATNCRTQFELAEVLSIRQSSVSDAKRRGSVPAEWLLTLLQGFGINPQWILIGEGAQFLEPTEKQPERNTAILRLCTECDTARGIWKRIDENRELLACLQQYAPEFLERCIWVEGWIATQDAFLNVLRELLDLPIVPRGHYRFPRPWPGQKYDAASLDSLRKHFLSDVCAVNAPELKTSTLNIQGQK